MKSINKLKYIIQKTRLSDILIIFDIDGVLLRNINIDYEFSPIITKLFEFIDKNNIKFGIATHGGNHVILADNISPISKYIRKLNQSYIKHIGQSQYEYSQLKYNMLHDLITQGINDYNIKSVIFVDDDSYNINSFMELQTIFSNLKLIPIPVKLNNTDIIHSHQYPLLRYESFNSTTTDFNNIFHNLII